MAAAVARRLLGGTVRVESAGIAAEDGALAARHAVEAMRERGIDLSDHRSRPLTGVAVSDFDLVVALSPGIAPSLPRNVGQLVVLDIPDPYGKSLAVYRDTARAIETALLDLLRPPSRELCGS